MKRSIKQIRRINRTVWADSVSHAKSIGIKIGEYIQLAVRNTKVTEVSEVEDDYVDKHLEIDNEFWLFHKKIARSRGLKMREFIQGSLIKYNKRFDDKRRASRP